MSHSTAIRLLHTADWHVGRTLRGRSRADEHEATLDALVALADDSGAQIVVVAGDLFDTAAPTPEAERLVYRTLLRLSERDRHVLVVAGNHDHPRRLGAVSPLLELTRVTLRPLVVPPAQGGIATLDVAGTAVRVAFLPWLSHRHAVSADELLNRDADQHNQSYLDRVRRISGALTAGFDGGTVNLVVGHLTAVGGVVGGGERAAHTVFDYAVPATIFPPTAGYVALGHLHRHQRIDGPAPTYYAGSPLQLDFGEGENSPGAVVVELAPGRPARPEFVPVDAARRLLTITGSLDELDLLAEAAGDAHLRVVVRERNRAGLADDVRSRFPRAVDARIEAPEERDRAGAGAGGTGAGGGAGGRNGVAPRRLGRGATELFAEFLAQQSIEDARLQALFARLVDEDAAEERDLDDDEPAAARSGGGAIDAT
ncbi:MAG: exonuclease subunit SbcD [Acidimicrobiales bacterium]